MELVISVERPANRYGCFKAIRGGREGRGRGGGGGRTAVWLAG